MQIIIDGYNVMFALGMIPKQMKPGTLQAARSAFLDLLFSYLGPLANETLVVFDAAHSLTMQPREFAHHGLHVQFAVRREEADDLIERQIKDCRAPERLVVISTDARLRQAARRQGATAVRSEEVLDWLEKTKTRLARSESVHPPAVPPSPPRETEYWLQQFKHLDDDTELGQNPWLGFEEK